MKKHGHQNKNGEYNYPVKKAEKVQKFSLRIWFLLVSPLWVDKTGRVLFLTLCAPGGCWRPPFEEAQGGPHQKAGGGEEGCIRGQATEDRGPGAWNAPPLTPRD